MKIVLITLTLILLHLHSSSAKNCQAAAVVSNCDTTDYKSYVECVRRSKRSIGCESDCGGDCESSCDQCDCNSCDECTSSSCDTCCNSCCTNFSSCTNNHCCHKSCHATCRTSSCRSSCRRNCYDVVREGKDKVVVVPAPSAGSSSLNNNEAHNITTIIHLNNLINNTNLIDVPITLNNTNINNITISAPDINPTVYIPGQPQVTNTKEIIHVRDDTPEESRKETNPNQCCTVVSPRQCVPNDKFPFLKCFHYRSNQCGSFCKSPIVHVEPHNVCDTQPSQPSQQPQCQQQLLYIPQPQPKCVYKSVWPYVSCTAPSQMPSCEGCYTHFVNPSSTNNEQCPSTCYDGNVGGFDVGPNYAQGGGLNFGGGMPFQMNPQMYAGGMGGENLMNFEPMMPDPGSQIINENGGIPVPVPIGVKKRDASLPVKNQIVSEKVE